MQFVTSGTDVLKLRLVDGKLAVAPTPFDVALMLIAMEQLRGHDVAVHAASEPQDVGPPLLLEKPGLTALVTSWT